MPASPAFPSRSWRGAALLLASLFLVASVLPALAHEEKDGPREGPAARAEKKKAKAEAAVRASDGEQAAAPAPAPSGSGAAPASAPADAPAAAATQPPAPPVVTSPFGPPWDPLQGPPEEPRESGPGIESLALVSSGRAEVEQLAGGGEGEARRYYGAVLELRIAPGSTSPLLGAASMFATAGDGEGEKVPAAVACLPTAGVQLSVWHAPGIGLSAWTVSVAGRVWTCSGRTARLAVRLRSGGLRLSTRRDAAWNGPFLLLFDTRRDDVRRIAVAGRTLDVPAAAPAGPGH